MMIGRVLAFQSTFLHYISRLKTDGKSSHPIFHEGKLEVCPLGATLDSLYSDIRRELTVLR